MPRAPEIRVRIKGTGSQAGSEDTRSPALGTPGEGFAFSSQTSLSFHRMRGRLGLALRRGEAWES